MVTQRSPTVITYHTIVQEVWTIFRDPPVPAMPLVQRYFEEENLGLLLEEYGDDDDQNTAEEILLALSAQNQGNQLQAGHEDHFSPAGFASLEQYAMVHMPIPISKAQRIPAAKAAVDA